MFNLLFVCMGNICRSPMAEGVTATMVRRRGLARIVKVDSAGTSRYHVGEVPDVRGQRVAARSGYDLSALRARRVVAEDFDRFTHILAMDRDNLRYLQEHCPEHHQDKLGLLLQYARHADLDEVPDPYYGGEAGFERVLRLVEDAAEGLLDAVTGGGGPQHAGRG